MRQPIQEGGRLGRYQLITRLATGGMAEVWLGRATGVKGFQKTIVLKTILPHLADDPDFLRMFVDEALLAAALNHPNIVQIFDLGQIGETYFIAMEYILGKTMRQVQRLLRKQRKVMPPWLVLRAVVSLCDALYYAHNKRGDDGRLLGVVHRDVTPENIMISFSGVTKVVDFGIAKASTAANITRAGKIKGKLSYLAPEQIVRAGKAPADRRSDIYSVGVVLYEMLTGVRPFRAPNDMALLLKIPKEEPTPPSEIARWVPSRLSDIVMRAMVKDPRDRYQDAAELSEDLEAFLTSVGTYPTERHISGYMCKLFDEVERQIPVPEKGMFPDELGDAGAARSMESGTGVELDGPDSAGSISIEISLHDALTTPSGPLPNALSDEASGLDISDDRAPTPEDDDADSKQDEKPAAIGAPDTAAEPVDDPPTIRRRPKSEIDLTDALASEVLPPVKLEPTSSGGTGAGHDTGWESLSVALTDEPSTIDLKTPIESESVLAPVGSDSDTSDDSPGIELPSTASDDAVPSLSDISPQLDVPPVEVDPPGMESSSQPEAANKIAPSPTSPEAGAGETRRGAASLFRSAGGGGAQRPTSWDALVKRVQHETGDDAQVDPEPTPPPEPISSDEGEQETMAVTSAEHAWDLLVDRAIQAEEESSIEMVDEGHDEENPREATPRPISATGWDAYIDRSRDRRGEPGQGSETKTAFTAGPRHLMPAAQRTFGSWKNLSEEESEAAAKFDEGLALIREGQRESALGVWERAVELDPDNRRYRGNLRLLKKAMEEEDPSA